MKQGRLGEFVAIILLGMLASGTAEAVRPDPPVRNWAVPGITAGSRTALTDIGVGPDLFVPITPCRLADTRAGSGFPAGYGPPSIAGGGTQRTFTITGQCGIPSGVMAVSFNFAVWGPPTRGDLRVFPAGGATPVVSTLNWEAGILALANAAIVPLGTGGAITLQVDGAGTVDIFFDVNGYFLGGGGGTINTDEYVNIVGNTGSSWCGLLFVENDSTDATTCISAVNAWAPSAANGAAVIGTAGGSGKSSGVKGTTSSTANDSSGVYGRSGPTFSINAGLTPAGVRGESQGGIGVLGISPFIGVGGRQVDGTGGLLSVGYLGYGGYALYGVGNSAVTGSKSFVDPHPTDATKIIKYVSLEGPESGTYFRGRARFDGRVAVIPVPEDFRLVSDEEGLTVHVTPIGRQASVWVTRMDLSEIVVESTRDVEFSYIVHGVRRTFRDFHPIQDNNVFVPESAVSRMPLAFSAEQKARLVANGTYNADGTVNMQTAERLGWAAAWRDRDDAMRKAALQAQEDAKWNPAPNSPPGPR